MKSHRIADVRARALTGHWHPALVDNALDEAQNRSNAAAWIDYIDIARNLQGVSFDQWQIITDYYLESKLKSPALFLRLLNHVLTPGMLHDSDEQTKQSACENLLAHAPGRLTGTIRDIAKRGYLGTCVTHYPGLLVQSDGIPEQLKGTFHSVQRHVKNAEALFASRKPFVSAIDDLTAICPAGSPSKTSIRVSVVGNSPTLLNEKSGTIIDAADIVVRFNRVSDLHRQKICTGKRTDIWVASPSASFTLCPADAKLVIVSGLHALDRASLYWRQLPTLERELSQFPAGIWYELVRCFQAPPSAGTLLLASLESLGHTLDIKTYGFTTSNIELNQLPNHHADQTPRSSRHNWAAELQWLSNRSA